MLEATSDHIQAVPPRSKPAKPKRISARMRRALDLLASGECKTQKAAAERVGITPDHLSRMIGRPEIQEFLTRESRRTVAVATLRAANVKVGLLDAQSEHVRDKVATDILAIGGIRAEQERGPLVNIAISPGYVIDLSDPRQAPGQVIEHTPSTDAVCPDEQEGEH